MALRFSSRAVAKLARQVKVAAAPAAAAPSTNKRMASSALLPSKASLIAGARRPAPAAPRASSFSTAARLPSSRSVATLLSKMSARPMAVNANVFASLRQISSRAFSSASAAPAAEKKKEDMMCFQCEQTRDGTGCTTVGVCGKTPEVAFEQDFLVHMIKGVSMWAAKAGELGAADREIDRFVISSLFTTLTNVNFDTTRMVDETKKALEMRQRAKQMYLNACKKAGKTADTFPASSAAEYNPPNLNVETLMAEGEKVGIRAKQRTLGEDYTGIQEMTVYGMKGVAAYANHASLLGFEDDAVFRDFHRLYADCARTDLTVDKLLANALAVGELNLRVMELLDRGHTTRYGKAEPTQVPTKPKPGKCILVSGHDLVDLESLLKQTEGTGVNVYTHGEMLPAHSYPGLKKYKHLAGHFGGAWQLQKFEFGQFPGPIVMTSNCLVEPKKSYRDRIFTRHAVGWKDIPHVEGWDFSPVIKRAQECQGFEADNLDVIPESVSHLTTGFGRHTVMSVADKVIDAVKNGAIKRFFVIGGCDGSEGERNYFKEIAMNTPKDSVILTLGCGKYRFNRLGLGEIGGIPRVLDMGQCNDAYSAISVASALAKAFNTNVTSLPLSFAVSWFEQKAVAVLLTLLHLGIQDIRLGPNLPGFATPNMLKFLVEKYRIKPIGNVQEDVQLMMQGK